MLVLEAARLLAAEGSPPRAIVLIDPAAERGVIPREFEPLLLDRLLAASAFTGIDDRRLLAMGRYLRLFGAWEPPALSAPHLIVRATDRIAPNAGEAAVVGAETVLAPGDHFSLMEEKVATTGALVEQWLSGSADAPVVGAADLSTRSRTEVS